MYSPNTIPALYKKFLRLYPREFRERLGASMEQTFNDLYQERQHERKLAGFMFWMFAETGVGILQEHMLRIAQGDSMKNIISNPSSSAITSLILSLPVGLTFVAFMLEIDQLTKPLTAVLTTNGYDLNNLGRGFLIGGMFLLPIAFVLNLRPMLRRQGSEEKRKLYTINLIACIIISLLILLTWGGLILEEIYCLQGIRCD